MAHSTFIRLRNACPGGAPKGFLQKASGRGAVREDPRRDGAVILQRRDHEPVHHVTSSNLVLFLLLSSRRREAERHDQLVAAPHGFLCKLPPNALRQGAHHEIVRVSSKSAHIGTHGEPRSLNVARAPQKARLFFRAICHFIFPE